MRDLNQEGMLCQNLPWQDWGSILELGRHVEATPCSWLESYCIQEERTAVFLSGRVGLRPISEKVDDGKDIIARAAPAIVNLPETDSTLEAHWITAPSSVYFFSSSELERAFATSSQFASNFMRVLQCQITMVIRSPDHSGSGSKRLATSLLARLSTDKSAGQKLYVTQAQLASETGLSRQWVNRLLKQFERQEIAKLGRGNVQLSAPAKLECLLD